MMFAPETPSIVEWCIFIRIATGPSANPSITHISHRGRSRRRGRTGYLADKVRERMLVTGGIEHHPV